MLPMSLDLTSAGKMPEAGEFVPYFQPVMVLRTGRLAGFEALSRWLHPEAGVIYPEDFIPLAEADGWIGELTLEILRRGFADFSSIHAESKTLDLAVNLSLRQLADAQLPQQLQSLSEQAAFPLDRLVLEITESAFTENPGRARAIAHELKDLGCRLALDDFGIGYSSLTQLQSLPFDVLKVDRRFVATMLGQRESRKIVAAVVGLGRSLGWATIAEGVESEQQAEMLQLMGCEMVQGKLYGMPVPATELSVEPNRGRASGGKTNATRTVAVGSRGTAAVMVESPLVRKLIGTSVARLGLSPRYLNGHSTGSGEDYDRYNLIVVDEAHPRALGLAIPKTSTGKSGMGAPVVIVREPGTHGNGETDLDFDGILQLPLASGEAERMLRLILHAHRSAALRYQAAWEELNLDRSVLASVTNGVSIADTALPDMPLVYVNPAFEAITGYGRNEVMGKNCRFLQGKDTEQPGLTNLRQAIREQRETIVVLKNYRKDGSLFWNEMYFSPLRDRSGRVSHYVGIQNDVTKRVEAERRLSFLANHDPLTGLANRTLLFARFVEARLNASRTGRGVALVSLDLDNFKSINDSFGHDAGDALLRTVAERLQGEVRGHDTVCRLGGDEFVVMVQEIEGEHDLAELTRRLAVSVQERIVLRDQELAPAASVGAALYPRDGENLDSLLKVADLAMYAHKHDAKSTRQSEDGVSKPIESTER